MLNIYDALSLQLDCPAEGEVIIAKLEELYGPLDQFIRQGFKLGDRLVERVLPGKAVAATYYLLSEPDESMNLSLSVGTLWGIHVLRELQPDLDRIGTSSATRREKLLVYGALLGLEAIQINLNNRQLPTGVLGVLQNNCAAFCLLVLVHMDMHGSNQNAWQLIQLLLGNLLKYDAVVHSLKSVAIKPQWMTLLGESNFGEVFRSVMFGKFKRDSNAPLGQFYRWNYIHRQDPRQGDKTRSLNGTQYAALISSFEQGRSLTDLLVNKYRESAERGITYYGDDPFTAEMHQHLVELATGDIVLSPLSAIVDTWMNYHKDRTNQALEVVSSIRTLLEAVGTPTEYLHWQKQLLSTAMRDMLYVLTDIYEFRFEDKS